MALNTLRKLFLLPFQIPAWEEADARSQYSMLWSYYHSNSLYENIQRYVDQQGLAQENLLPLRNPANRTVEFYTSKLWPETLVPETDNDSIKDPLKRIWNWSNWDTKKWFAARQLACLGDLFIRVSSTSSLVAKPRVYFEILKTEDVTDFDVDGRGFLSTLRIDQRITHPDNASRETWYTEYWTPDFLMIWFRNDKGPSTSLKNLGNPDIIMSLPEDLGIDFIPVVYAQLKDTGAKRGQGAFLHAIDKIDEANRIATRLHSLMYRYNAPMWVASAGGNDSSGRPLPAPRLGRDGTDRLEVEDSSVIRMPGNGQFRAVIAGVDWNAHLNSLNAHLEEISHDLPELAYYQVRKMTQISGRAVQYLLSDAIDRAKQARSNALGALAKADMMALTIGNNIKAFSVPGSFDDDEWFHTFEKEDIFPVSAMEEAEAMRMDADGRAIRKNLGVSEVQTLRELGYEDDEISKMQNENEEKAKQALENAKMMAEINPPVERTPPPQRPAALNRE